MQEQNQRNQPLVLQLQKLVLLELSPPRVPGRPPRLLALKAELPLLQLRRPLRIAPSSG